MNLNRLDVTKQWRSRIYTIERTRPLTRHVWSGHTQVWFHRLRKSRTWLSSVLFMSLQHDHDQCLCATVMYYAVTHQPSLLRKDGIVLFLNGPSCFAFKRAAKILFSAPLWNTCLHSDEITGKTRKLLADDVKSCECLFALNHLLPLLFASINIYSVKLRKSPDW